MCDIQYSSKYLAASHREVYVYDRNIRIFKILLNNNVINCQQLCEQLLSQVDYTMDLSTAVEKKFFLIYFNLSKLGTVSLQKDLYEKIHMQIK